MELISSIHRRELELGYKHLASVNQLPPHLATPEAEELCINKVLLALGKTKTNEREKNEVRSFLRENARLELMVNFEVKISLKELLNSLRIARQKQMRVCELKSGISTLLKQLILDSYELKLKES